MDFWTLFVAPLETTLGRVANFLPRFLVSTFLFFIFWGMASVARKLSKRTLNRFPHLHWALRLVVARTIFILTLVLGVVVSLSAANVDITALLTSLGVAGFAVGFALKDILENFISGILLLFARPFEIGDQVVLGKFEGVVTDIELRTTSIRTYDDEIVMIPNATVYSNPVTNHTRLGQRRYTLDFDTGFQADTAQVEALALAAMTSNTEISEQPSPFVRVIALKSAADCISWRAYFWAAPGKAAEVRSVSRTLVALKAALCEANVPLPVSPFGGVWTQPASGADPESGAEPESAETV